MRRVRQFPEMEDLSVNRKTRLVLRGYLDLSESERRDLIRELNRVIELSEVNKSARKRDISMELGPVSSGCPCCGR